MHGSSVDGHYTVAGAITVTNPNASAVSGVGVTDALPGAVVDCPATTIAGKGQLECTYTWTGDGTKPTSNTASVSVSGNSSLDNTSSPVAIAFGPPTVVNGVVDVTDAFNGGAAAVVAGGTGLTPADLDQSGDKVLTYDRTLTCGATHTYGNTAVVAGPNGEVLDDDSAGVDVTCKAPKPLTVTKTAHPSFTRTYDWKVTKASDPSVLNLKDGATGSSTWTVKLEQVGEPVDSGWRLTGTITVTNPNGFPVGGISVSDGLGGTVTCPASTIAANSSLICSYSVGLQGGASGTNTATATTTTQGVGSGSGSAQYAFTEPTNVVNGTVDVVDTNGKTWNDRTDGLHRFVLVGKPSLSRRDVLEHGPCDRGRGSDPEHLDCDRDRHVLDDASAADGRAAAAGNRHRRHEVGDDTDEVERQCHLHDRRVEPRPGCGERRGGR